MAKAPPSKKLSVNFSFDLFSLLDFLTPEDGAIGYPETSVRN